MDESGNLDPAEPAGGDAERADPETQYVRPSNQSTIPPRPAAAAIVALPEQFGRYRIVRLLGQGAMGAVYLAHDTHLERPVALKIPKFTEEGDAELVERFYREARAAATVRHAHLCPVYDCGEIDGVRYLSMAFIEGRLLSDVLAETGRRPVHDAVALVLKLARGLGAAHAAGVIHRDLKPGNIMIDANDEPILMDFGLARRVNAQDSRLTQSGLVMGSPTYMSPEQVEGDPEKLGPACDIYSLGVILYELLTGDVPFRGSIAAVMGQIVTTNPKRPSERNREVDAQLDAICLKMMAKRPEDRFASMREVAAALEAYQCGRPTGVAVERVANDGRESPAAQAPPRGIMVAPWMLWTAVAVVVLGFGVTWQLIALLMRQAWVDELKLNTTQKAVASGEAKVLLNGDELTADQLSHPYQLAPGKYVVETQEGGRTKDRHEITSDEDSPLVLENMKFIPRHRRLAVWLLSNGATVRLANAAKSVDAPQALPAGKLLIEEIDLSGVSTIPPEQFASIKSLKKTLKRLVLPKAGLSEQQLAELHAALDPDCKIERAGA